MTNLTDRKPACISLILDAGPLLSLSPLRGLAETFYTVPQVLDELKDRRAREHFEQLGLSAGVKIEVQSPDAASLAYVIQFAKKTGDYSVLSHADLSVLALTYSLDKRAKEAAEQASLAKPSDENATSLIETPVPVADDLKDETAHSDRQDKTYESENEEPPSSETPSEEEEEEEFVVPNEAETENQAQEPLAVQLQSIDDNDKSGPSSIPSAGPSSASTTATTPPPKADDVPVYDDPSDEDDDEGEWITPSNVALHKSKALHLVPDDNAAKKGARREQIAVGCMTADFAMQNVLLQMGLSLVGVEGKKIEKVKTWVLRCHACFKICKDNARKFCPSCGNPTLLRASVTLSSPKATSSTPTLQVHLKKNFQYKTRGTVYSIPAPKPGSAKNGGGEGLILREDQTAWIRAKKHADGKREREEKRLLACAAKNKSQGVAVSSWMDPDWVPEILSVGAGGKGRSMRSRGYDGDMPVIGYGKKNPNERKRRK